MFSGNKIRPPPAIWQSADFRRASERAYRTLNKEEFKGTVMRIPTRDEIQPIANEQAVVEFYSR